MWVLVTVISSLSMIIIVAQGNLDHEFAPSPWLEDWDTCRCGKSSVSIAQESGSGQAVGDILLHFKKSSDDWRIRILFNQVVNNLKDTAGRKAGCDKKACVLESKGSKERSKKVLVFLSFLNLKRPNHGPLKSSSYGLIGLPCLNK